MYTQSTQVYTGNDAIPTNSNIPEIAPAIAVKVRWPELMGISTLAEYLDMSASTVRALVDKGILPPPTTAPSPRLKRWKRSVIDERLQRLAEKNSGPGMTMDHAIQSLMTSSKGGH